MLLAFGFAVGCGEGLPVVADEGVEDLGLGSPDIGPGQVDSGSEETPPSPVGTCEPYSSPTGCGTIEDCATVLETELGLSVTRQSSEELRTREMAKAYLCSESNGAYLYDEFTRESGGGGVNVIAFFKASGGAEVLRSRETFQTWQRSSCSQDVEEAELDSLRQFFVSIADNRPNIQAWTQCVNTVAACHAAAAPQPKGLTAVLQDPTTNVVAIEMRWCGTVGDVTFTQATLHDLTALGLDCDLPFDEGEVVPVGETTVFCERANVREDGVLGVSLDVQVSATSTRRYSAVAHVPGIPEEEPPPPVLLWFFDPDGDGYAAADARSQWMDEVPPGQEDLWTLRAPTVWTDTDCCELDANTRPGQEQYFGSPNYCGNYDYDCNGEEKHRYEGLASCLARSRCQSTVQEAGWQWASEVACGAEAAYSETGLRCGRCRPWESESRRQLCR